MSARIDWIAMKALEKDRTRRYDSPVQLSEDVERFLSGEAILARPPSLAYRLSKHYRRHRILINVTAIILLITSISGLFAFSGWQESKKAELIVGISKTEVSAAETKALAEAAKAREEAARAKAAESKATAAQAEVNLQPLELEANLARTNYHLAISYWNQNRVAEAIDYLERVPEEHRQFEWHLARHQFEGSDLTCYGHRSSVYSVSFSPDGQQIVSGSEDGTIKLWDAQTGEELRTLRGHAGRVLSVSFSPDGRRIVSLGRSGKQMEWDLESGKKFSLKTTNPSDWGMFYDNRSPNGR